MAVGVIVAALCTAAATRSATAALPAVVTLQGVGGAKVGMNADQLRKAWGRPVQVIESARGSSEVAFAPICAGRQQGVAVFFWGELSEIRFYRGARTDARIRIGSRVEEVKKVYGGRLERTWDSLNGRVVYAVPGPGTPKPVIVFLQRAGRVSEIRYGKYQALSRGTSWADDLVFGIDCGSR